MKMHETGLQPALRPSNLEKSLTSNQTKMSPVRMSARARIPYGIQSGASKTGVSEPRKRHPTEA
jgi:hypothetical protein